MRNSLPKTVILRGYKIFRHVYENGTRLQGGILDCYVLFETDTENRSTVQWGFSVAKKKYPRAVDRNRMRRLMKESIRLHSRAVTEHCHSISTQAKIIIAVRNTSVIDVRRVQLSTIMEDWTTLSQAILSTTP